jgi:hypothetical protein
VLPDTTVPTHSTVQISISDNEMKSGTEPSFFPARFQVLSNHMWLAASLGDRAEVKWSHPECSVGQC